MFFAISVEKDIKKILFGIWLPTEIEINKTNLRYLGCFHLFSSFEISVWYLNFQETSYFNTHSLPEKNPWPCKWSFCSLNRNYLDNRLSSINSFLQSSKYPQESLQTSLLWSAFLTNSSRILQKLSAPLGIWFIRSVVTKDSQICQNKCLDCVQVDLNFWWLHK